MNRRFALIQAIISLLALAAVVWWASHQEAPTFPHSASALAWIGLGAVLYTIATLVRSERWHRILELIHVKASRADCYGLTTVGYMGNNVLPARAGEALRVVLLSARTGAGKRELAGTIVAERLLDSIALGAILIGTVYGVLKGDVLPHDTWLAVGVLLGLVAVGFVVVKIMGRRGALTRLRELARPLAGAPRALWSSGGLTLLAVSFVLWSLEAGVYLSVARAVDLHISTSGAYYLVALANFVAAVPAAPGSIGTFDGAVAFGAKALGGAGGTVVSYVLMLRFVLYVPITVVGLVILVVRYGGWSRLRAATRLEATQA
jgi:glycosyltransferase 2 family protein